MIEIEIVIEIKDRHNIRETIFENIYMSWLSSDCIFNKRKRPKKNSANTNNNDSKKRVNLFFQYKKKLLINVIYLFNRGYI